jgi:hypothetical protein
MFLLFQCNTGAVHMSWYDVQKYIARKFMAVFLLYDYVTCSGAQAVKRPR